MRDGLEAGPLAGFPVVNVSATLTDGSYHSVDSNEMAFRIAAKEAMRKALSQGSPVLLEPIHTLSVTLPDELMGDVLGHLNSKRGQVLGVDAVRHGWSQITADEPLAEVAWNRTELRSMTQGRAIFSMTIAAVTTGAGQQRRSYGEKPMTRPPLRSFRTTCSAGRQMPARTRVAGSGGSVRAKPCPIAATTTAHAMMGWTEPTTSCSTAARRGTPGSAPAVR